MHWNPHALWVPTLQNTSGFQKSKKVIQGLYDF